jgi:hypothetical protein
MSDLQTRLIYMPEEEGSNFIRNTMIGPEIEAGIQSESSGRPWKRIQLIPAVQWNLTMFHT